MHRHPSGTETTETTSILVPSHYLPDIINYHQLRRLKMLNIIEFEDFKFRKYGLQNCLTGYVLHTKRGKARRYFTVKGAERAGNRITDRLNRNMAKALANINKRKAAK
jgi:hypothetical protein